MRYAPFDRLSPQLSALISDGLCGVLLLGWIVALLVMAVRDLGRARDALAMVATRLRPGVHTVRGVARWERAEDPPPVSLTVEMLGEQHHGKHGPYVKWREVRRVVRARPFYVELDSGERVRVEPEPERLRYIDDLSVSERSRGLNRLTRIATLDQGEPVYVRGELQRGLDPHGAPQGYRDLGARALVLRPASDGMLVSSHAVDRHHRRRALHNLGFALAGVAVLAALQLALFDDLRALRWQGAVTQATVTGRTLATTRYKGGVRVHYRLTARLPDGTLVQDEVSQAAWRSAAAARTMPFTVARGGRVAQAGVCEVGLHRPHAVLAGFAVLALVALHAASAAARRPWFERARLDETEPGMI